MADAAYDAVIIGGGQHGLILGCYLQDAGMSTVVLERQYELGGGMSCNEAIAPGFLLNTHASATRFYTHPVCADFNLREKGLQFVFPEGPGSGGVFDNGKCIVNYTAYKVVEDGAGWRHEFWPEQVEKSLAQIARFSERDAEVVRRFADEWHQKWEKAFFEYYFNPPDPWGVKNPIERAVEELQHSGIEPVIEPVHDHMFCRQLAYDLFESDEMRSYCLRCLMASTAHHIDGVPGIVQLVGVLGLILALRPVSIVIGGGMHHIIHALQRAYTEMGGKFFLHSEVDKIIIDNGRAKGVRLVDGTVIQARKLVASCVDVTQTILRFVGEEYVSPKIAHRARNIWYGFGILWTNVAMYEAPKYVAAEFNPDCLRLSRLSVGVSDPEYLTKKFVAECYLQGFARRMCMFTVSDTRWDKTRAPRDYHIVGLEWGSAPTSYYTEKEWLQIKRDFPNELIRQWQWYAPNMTWDNVIGIDIQCPLDFERRMINFQDGDTSMGRMITSQLGRFRPFPELSRYKTPIQNLYISGAGTHPGFGTGRPNSYNCFKVIAEDFGLKKIWEEKGRPW